MVSYNNPTLDRFRKSEDKVESSTIVIDIYTESKQLQTKTTTVSKEISHETVGSGGSKIEEATKLTKEDVDIGFQFLKDHLKF